MSLEDEGTVQTTYSYVIYMCGCRLTMVKSFPLVCCKHKKVFIEVGPMLLMEEQTMVDQRYVC